MNTNIMKTNFTNFWKGIAVAAVLSASAIGYAEASKLQTATHYNAETNPALPANWQPINPLTGAGMGTCEVNEENRPCKAVQLSGGGFNPIEFGDLIP